MASCVSRCTLTQTTDSITHPTVHTQAGLQATIPIVSVSTGLVTEEPRPPRLACALSLQWVTTESVLAVTQAVLFTVHAKGSISTHPLRALGSPEARLTQAAAIDVIAACTISAVTHTLTVLPIAPHCTLFVTPLTSEARSTLTVSLLWVTVTTIMAQALLRTIYAKSFLRTSFCTYWPCPSRWAQTHSFPLADASVLARAARCTPACPHTGSIT